MSAHYSRAAKAEILKTSYFIFFLAASFTYMNFYCKWHQAVMAEPMMRTFAVTGRGLRLLSAFYFYAYAPMQLPAGVYLTDMGRVN